MGVLEGVVLVRRLGAPVPREGVRLRELHAQPGEVRVDLHLAFDVVRQIGDVVGGGLAETDYKLRDITGALKDLEDILDVVSEEDGEEKAFRLEKLRREVTKTEGENELTVTLEGVDEEWGE